MQRYKIISERRMSMTHEIETRLENLSARHSSASQRKHSDLKRIIYEILKVVLPILLAAAILWWMYRGFEWEQVKVALQTEMSWTWMWLSLPFGILAQVFRALRWRQSLEPIGENPRCHTSICAIFLSYASSLVVPRIGEILRCGVLSRWDGVRFSHSVGTVVSERVVDMLLVLLLSFVTIAFQIPVFVRFMARTGMSLHSLLDGFSLAGYLVTALCIVLIILTLCLLFRKYNIYTRTRSILSDLMVGLLSVRKVRKPMLFLGYSVGIWAAYYLHFYLTFFCFGFTECLGATAAMVAFIVGSFAVLVPTPNGAGPWHFAVKTALVLYGVGNVEGAVFVLVVHTIQTLLVLVLGLYALGALSLISPRDVEKKKLKV